MKSGKTYLAGWMVAFLIVFLFAGCGEQKKAKEWDANGLAVEKNGQVVYCVVDSFEKGFYDVGELTGMAVEEAAIFNGKNKEGDSAPVTVEDVSIIEGNDAYVRVVYRFDNVKSYEKFQGETLYFGTLQEAVQGRHIFSGAVVKNGDGNVTLDEKTVAKIADNHVVVTDAKNVIWLPFDLLYYSEGVQVLSDGCVDTTKCTDMVILVMKK